MSGVTGWLRPTLGGAPDSPPDGVGDSIGATLEARRGHASTSSLLDFPCDVGVDVRSVAKAGARVTLAVVASLLALGAVSLGLIHVLGLV